LGLKSTGLLRRFAEKVPVYSGDKREKRRVCGKLLPPPDDDHQSFKSFKSSKRINIKATLKKFEFGVGMPSLTSCHFWADFVLNVISLATCQI
jgi:hypothetical protein